MFKTFFSGHNKIWGAQKIWVEVPRMLPVATVPRMLSVATVPRMLPVATDLDLIFLCNVWF